MTAVAEALEQVRSTLVDVLRFDDPAQWSDDELLAATASIEAVGRLIDAHRAACAGEIDERSRVELGSDRLSSRRGCRSASELVERVTQVSGAEARRRIALGAATRGRVGFTGESLEPSFPRVAAALAVGVLGADAAGRSFASSIGPGASPTPSSSLRPSVNSWPRRPARAMAA